MFTEKTMETPGPSAYARSITPSPFLAYSWERESNAKVTLQSSGEGSSTFFSAVETRQIFRTFQTGPPRFSTFFVKSRRSSVDCGSTWGPTLLAGRAAETLSCEISTNQKCSALFRFPVRPVLAHLPRSWSQLSGGKAAPWPKLCLQTAEPD